MIVKNFSHRREKNRRQIQENGKVADLIISIKYIITQYTSICNSKSQYVLQYTVSLNDVNYFFLTKKLTERPEWRRTFCQLLRLYQCFGMIGEISLLKIKKCALVLTMKGLLAVFFTLLFFVFQSRKRPLTHLLTGGLAIRKL